MVYAGHSTFRLRRTRNITMEQHLACSCRDCSAEQPLPQCSEGHVIGSSCRCECSNQVEKGKCKGGLKVWDEIDCRCKCSIKRCSFDSRFNQENCECEKTPQLRLEVPSDGINHFGARIDSLPRLRPRIRSRYLRQHRSSQTPTYRIAK
ncbi:hypothetical protein AB6A40_000716 [Gnathostoma spinigerum]|uniref:Uncharacterized protein n=1 Tax=Gnathostoma spinigerum TaxID=75299 RepID=A0ABD6E4Q1_9BILA